MVGPGSQRLIVLVTGGRDLILVNSVIKLIECLLGPVEVAYETIQGGDLSKGECPMIAVEQFELAALCPNYRNYGRT